MPAILDSAALPIDAVRGSLESDLHAAGRASCLHCALPLTPEQRDVRSDFCCTGCRAVYTLIHDEGLDRYYDLKTGATAPAAPVRGDGMAWLEPLLARTAQGEVASLTLDVQGIQCTACVWLLQELFRRSPGAVSLRVNPALGKADLCWRPGQLDLRTYLAEVERFGYRFGPPHKVTAPRSRGLLTRLGLCAVLAMNVMIFSLCFYTGMGPEDGSVYRLFGLLSFLMTFGAVLAGGSLFIESAARGLRVGVVHLDLPIALGIVLGFAGSSWTNFTQGAEHAFFDTVTTFVTLMVVGRWLQERVLERNRHALLSADGVEHLFTRRVEAGRLEAVPVTSIRTGDELWVVPGDLVAVDGDVLEETAAVSLDWITGESDRVPLRPGDAVPAGAWNAGESTLRLRARQDFSASRLHELLRTPPRRDPATDPSRRYERRFSAIYVGLVLLLGAIGFALWMPRGFDRALAVATSILIVTCPCAIGLATPLAHELTHLALRRRGVFLRDDRFLTRALFVRKVLFDKTGTLTMGGLVLSGQGKAALALLGPAEQIALWNLVVRSNHPMSRCLAESVPLAARRIEALTEVTERAGDGVLGRQDGHELRIGRRSFALSEPGDDVEGATLRSGHDSKPGESWTYFTRDGRLLAAFSLEEELRRDAASEIARLSADGFELHLLSGDRAAKVAAVAETLGIDPTRAHGDLTPEAKASRVRALDAHDTLMVGDGLNDSPSFAAAYCAATPAVDRPALPARASFYFLGEGIAAVRRSLEAARRLRAVLRGNLALALGYNAIALTLCFLGLVGPVLAAILMPLSSITVVAATVLRLSERNAKWMS
ncbi:MAG: heavy metal translocating P-type ATPase [Candidatus Eisenbacteria bacterium]|nr:heavy metal translocating P-type ATPase [Candidatus Eisenbacteria bacterium]